MVGDHQIILVAPVVADKEGGLGTLQPVARKDDLRIQLVAQMRTGIRQPVAHEGDLRIQLVAQMRTGTRQPVAHEVADNSG